MPSLRVQWESIIEGSLKGLSCFLKESDWYGRENEIINLYAHRFVLENIKKGPLIDPTQIGIEVAVKQLQRCGGKKLVRKDLVLWNHPLETVWGSSTARNFPAAILEWKTEKIPECKVNIDWLKAYTRIYPQVLGYSVCAFIRARRGIWYRKIVNGRAGIPKVFGD